jgi:4-oxalocrotonate tautomerase
VPYVDVRITAEGNTAEQKAQVIHEITDVLTRVLGKDPATTHVVITEIPLDNWGIAGLPTPTYRAGSVSRGA